MKWILYNILFLLAYPFLLPGFLLRMFRRGGYAARMGDRIGLYPEAVRARFRQASPTKRPVWLHAVSVGEVQVAGQLMRAWRQVEPDVSFCFSTTSSTGWKMAEREITPADTLVYNPLDFPAYVKSALGTVRPRAVVLTESEIWPNFIRRAKKLGIPLFLVNARVSDRSAPRYRLARWWFADVFACFTRIFAQSDLDKARLVAAGAPAERIDVTGSFKFDVARRDPAKETELKTWLAAVAGRKILLGGSTWPGEDKVLLDHYKTMDSAAWALVIAPRHFEKADQIETNIRSAGFGCVRRSRPETVCEAEKGNAVYLADTTGELMGLYGLADLVFIGKSLCAVGAQNMIEPCLCGKPTFVGPHTENFRPVMSDLLAADAIEQVADARALGERLAFYAANASAREALGNRARAAVERRCGVVPRCVTAVRKALALALALVLFGTGCSKETETRAETETPYVFEPLRVAAAYTGLVEKPDATNALLLGTEAATLRPYLTRAGLDCRLRGKGVYDLLFVSAETISRESCRRAVELLDDDGVFVWLTSVKDVSMQSFAERFMAIDLKDVHLWAPGEHRWIVTGRKTAKKRALSAMLDVFTREGTFIDAERSACRSVPLLFANYVGTAEDVMPAFRTGDLTADIAPQFVLTKEIPALGWIEPGELDEDIAKETLAEIRSMQVVRRLAVEGNMKAAANDEKGSVDCWSRAARRNPDDLFILERLDRLDRNAKGFLEVQKVLLAMKCYETMLLVKPTPAAVHNFGQCLKKIGKNDMAEKVLKHAEDLLKQQ